MRAVVAVFFLLATSANGYNQPNNVEFFREALSCVKQLGFSKCVTAYSVWRVGRTLEANKHSFEWREYVNITDEDLYARLCADTKRMLQYHPLVVDFHGRYNLRMKSTGNDSLSFDIIENKEATSRTSDKKMTKMFYQALPFLILPGLVMSAILPFFLPTLKMATIATVMLNNMALMGAIFTLLRNNAFNDRNYPKKVVYLNAGYTRAKYDPLLDSPSEPIGIDDVAPPNLESHYNTEVTHDSKDYHLVGVDPNTGISYPFKEEWLKPTENSPGKVKNVQIMGEVPSVGDWLKPNFKWPPTSKR